MRQVVIYWTVYTVITNIITKDRMGIPFTMIKEVNANTINEIVLKMFRQARYKCRGITIDFANSVFSTLNIIFNELENKLFNFHKPVYELCIL